MIPSVIPLLRAAPVEECSICHELIDLGRYRTECGHIYHRRCLNQWFGYSRTCPQCRQSINLSDMNQLIILRLFIVILGCAVTIISCMDLLMTNATITKPLSGLHIIVYFKLVLSSFILQDGPYKKAIIIAGITKLLLIIYSISLIIQYDEFQTYIYTSKAVIYYDLIVLATFVIFDIMRTIFTATREFLTL